MAGGHGGPVGVLMCGRMALLLALLMVPFLPLVAAGLPASTVGGGTGIDWQVRGLTDGQGVPHGHMLAVPDQMPGPLTGWTAPTEEARLAQRDVDGDHVEDGLQQRLATRGVAEELPLLVLYERAPGRADRQALEAAGAPGSRLIVSLDAVTTSGVPSQVAAYATLPGVQLVVERGQLAWFGDVQTRSTLARPSDNYAEVAWDLGVQGRNVTVALTDTGVDDEHPSFAGRFVAGVDTTKLEGPDILNPLGEGLFAPRDGSYNPDDEQGHGTSCFGMCAGTGAPDLEYMGAAPAARLVDVRIGTELGVGPGEEPIAPQWYDSALEGLDWDLQNAGTEWADVGPELYGIDIVSLSWGIYPPDGNQQGSDGSDEYSVLINDLVAAGVHVVNAAGNEGPDNDGLWGLAAASDTIVVAASDDHDTVIRDDDTIADYSSRGPRRSNDDGNPYDELIPTVGASGTNISQATADTNTQGDASSNGYNDRGSGTSYATPAVAGVVALMLEANPDLEPLVTREILKATATRMGEPSAADLDPYWNREWGWGSVNGRAAVEMAFAMRGASESIDLNVQLGLDTVSSAPEAALLEGQAWARGGLIERVEWRATSQDWHEATYAVPLDELAAGEAFGWSVALDPSTLGLGNHTVQVRAVGTDGVGLTLTAQVLGVQAVDDVGVDVGWIALILAFVVLVLVVALIVQVTQPEDSGLPPGFSEDPVEGWSAADLERVMAEMRHREALDAVIEDDPSPADGDPS